MISEVVNALLLTYLATEYMSQEHGPLHHRRRHGILVMAVGIVNVLDRVSGAAAWAQTYMYAFWHAPKILFAIFAYVLALYVDCRQRIPPLSVRVFVEQVGISFLYILPVYPCLAVLVSFGFLMVLTIWDALHLPEEWLNWPIYYGTLYGPFSLVYGHVKQELLLQHSNTLPSWSSSGRVVGKSGT
jgi:hypothetical protein